MMGIQPHQYRSFTMVRKRVLQIAIEEINDKTDIQVDYELEKQGKKIAAIIFKMRPKSNSITGTEQHDKIKDKLNTYGIKDDKIETLLNKHDEEYLWANIRIVEEQINK